MAFDELWDDCNEMLCSSDVFGSAVTIRRQDGSAFFEVEGVFNTEDVHTDIDGSLISTTLHTLGLRRGSLPWEPRQQDLVLINEATWVVVDIQDEGAGVITLQLHLQHQ